MPIKKAAEKALRQTKKRRARNLRTIRSVKQAVKDTRKAVASSSDTSVEVLKKTLKALDKAAQKKVIKKNKADRLKSRLTRSLNRLKKK